jgi:hypothetical protein
VQNLCRRVFSQAAEESFVLKWSKICCVLSWRTEMAWAFWTFLPSTSSWGNLKSFLKRDSPRVSQEYQFLLVSENMGLRKVIAQEAHLPVTDHHQGQQ